MKFLFYLFNLISIITSTLNDFSNCQLNNQPSSTINNIGLDDEKCKDFLKCDFNQILDGDICQDLDQCLIKQEFGLDCTPY
jgi:hypothetical protein